MKRCVYTVLTGGYEPLNEQLVARESALPFICFTDDSSTTCEGWEIRRLEPVFSADDIRNQRTYKLQPHLVLPEFDQSLYMDNSIRLLTPPERIFEAADLSTGMCLPSHSYRESLLDEFLVIAKDSIDDPRRVMEQLKHYQNAFPEVLAGPVYWSALLLRDHRSPQVRAAMTIWLAHVYRYSRRDQLSNSVAFHLAGLKPAVLAVDNFESEFHSWPHVSGRKAERRSWIDESADAVVLRSEYLNLQQTLGEVQREREALLVERQLQLQEYETLRCQRDETQRERDTLLHERNGMQHERGVMLHERNILQHERNVLQHERDALLHLRDALLHSMSWRVTLPLRGLKIAATALKNRLAATDREEVL